MASEKKFLHLMKGAIPFGQYKSNKTITKQGFEDCGRFSRADFLLCLFLFGFLLFWGKSSFCVEGSREKMKKIKEESKVKEQNPILASYRNGDTRWII